MWKGSLLGCWLSGQAQWAASMSVADGAPTFTLRARKTEQVIAIADIHRMDVNKGWLWAALQVQTKDGVITLHGMSHALADGLVVHLETAVMSHLGQRLNKLEPLVRSSSAKVDAFLSQDRYLRHSDVVDFQAALRHGKELADMVLDTLDHPYARRIAQSEVLIKLARHIAGALKPGSDTIKHRNEAFILREMKDHAAFFDVVEKTKLTEEQRRAAIIFEDRNLLVAAAGSGKSSTLIGKAGYAIRRGLFKPSEIVALAFSRKAAAELNGRIRLRLGPSLGDQRLRANTFHALGALIVRSVARQSGTKLRLVKKDSEKPRLDAVLKKLSEDTDFLGNWLHFASLCKEPVPADDAFESFEDYEKHVESKRQARRNGKAADFQPLVGGPVRSAEELAIANWLYLNGIPFEYEKRFEPHPPEWEKFEPDFYFPDIDCWYEHFGLNAQGEAPRFFRPGYAAQAAKKRQWLDQHAAGRWFETRSHQYREGVLFDELKAALQRHGQVFQPRSADEVLARVKVMRQTDVLDLILKILHLVKGNGFDRDEVARRANSLGDNYRAQMFTRVFWPLYDGYNKQLADERAIDFDDMILLAAQYVERGQYASPYKLVMVDEFQDMSPGRARLVKALLAQQRDSVLFGVGDDWQAIFGFTGSDLQLFMEFEKVFGATSENLLSKTFRCPQGISDVAAAFIQKNKRGQKPKSVESELDPRVDTVVDLYDVKRNDDVASEVEALLSKLASDILSLHGGKPPEKTASVYLLSRYKINNTDGFDAGVLAQLQAKFADVLDIEFMTAHKSKGLEADYVVLLGMNDGYGLAFPSTIKNDPLLEMMLSMHDAFPFAEERRLFYVALTRAKKKCFILFRQRDISPFVLELLSPHFSKAITYRGGPLPKRCGTCGKGFLVPRPSRINKPFLGCTRYSSNGGCGHQETI